MVQLVLFCLLSLYVVFATSPCLCFSTVFIIIITTTTLFQEDNIFDTNAPSSDTKAFMRLIITKQ